MKKGKRIDVVSLQMVKEKTLWYLDRKITSPADAAKIMRDFVGNPDKEILVLLGLNTKNEPTHASIISVGSLNSSIIHPREIFKIAIGSNSHSVIIGHNHPSGNTEPSNEDIEATKRLLNAGTLIGIELLDHIIFTSDSYLSIRETGRL